MRVDLDAVSLTIAPTASMADAAAIVGRGVVSAGDFTTIEDGVLIDLGGSGRGRVELDSRVKLKYGSVYRCYNGALYVGARTTIGEYTVVLSHGGVSIGSDTAIASHCSIVASNHITEDPDIPIRYQGETASGIVIGRGVWIGSGVRILDGVSVGDGTVIGAGSVVTRSLPSRHVCVGAPCRPVREIGLDYHTKEEVP